MTEAQVTRNTKIKTFEQRVLNRSFTDLLFYDKLADYMLECCHAEAKPNTLSLFSFVPLFILSFIVTGPSTIAFLLSIGGILLHQLLDIANKKQAYRLSQFSLATYYIDHLFDSLSCCYIVLIVGRLLQMNNISILTAVFFFGMLPFYTHHLAMYNDEYLSFPLISPTSEGLILIKLLFLIAAFVPSFFSLELFPGVQIYNIFLGLASIWLIIFVSMDIMTIVKGKRVTDIKAGIEEHFPLKNLYVIFMLGYVIMQITSIESILLYDSTYFYLAFASLSIIFAQIINNLVLSYGYNEKYKQITVSFLVPMAIIILYYTLCAFVLSGNEIEDVLSKVIIGITFSLILLIFVRESWANIQLINQIISA